jgi:hypothetical protein
MAEAYPFLRRNPHDVVRSPLNVEVQRLQALVAEARYADAIGRARIIYAIHFPGAFALHFAGSGYPYPDDAITLPERRAVLITANAFVSVPWLARTILHERVHIEQYLRGDWGAPGSLGESLNEVEAYDRVRRAAGPLGLSTKERDTDVATRTSYFRALDAGYRMRIMAGSYEIRDADRAPGAPLPVS